jgi:DGQHR domain-containing protein
VIYRFGGPDEERRALSWMKARLLDVQEHHAEGQDQEIQQLLNEIDERLKLLNELGRGRSGQSEEELWERFIFGVSGVWPDEDDQSSDDAEPPEPPFVWGEWDLTSTQDLKLGYSQFLLQTLIPRGGESTVHFYSRTPPPIHWDLTPIRQKSVSFLIGKGKVCEIDAVSSVPQLPQEIDSNEAGLRVLNPSRGEQEWQRRIEALRVLAIRNFISDRANIIANSVILYAPDSRAFSRDSGGHVKIDLSMFLARDKGRWTDHLGNGDLRPLWLIDGQHRIRGLAQSTGGIDLEVPLILFPPEFSLGQSAKIFAEINTLQKKLSPLHTLFMQHRFGIPSPVTKRDFRRPWSTGDAATWNSRANHLSYECAASLASSDEGPLFNRIRILDQNEKRYPIIQASQWVDFSRFWFLEGGIYGPDRPEDQKAIDAEVENFFSAFVRTCNHEGWDDGRMRWSLSGKDKGLLQRQGPSQALLRLYPTVWRVARAGHKETPIPEERFIRALKPLTWVDWIHPDLLSTFLRGGERGRSSIRVWMETAVRHGKEYPLPEVMSDGIHSEPGRGILASPGRGTLDIVSELRWPAPGRPILLRASQPANTLPGSSWQVFDSSEQVRTPDDAFVLAKGGTAELELHYDRWMEHSPYFAVRVDWINAVDPPGGSTIRVKR